MNCTQISFFALHNVFERKDLCYAPFYRQRGKVIAHTCNFSALESKAESLHLQGQPGIHSQTRCQKRISMGRGVGEKQGWDIAQLVDCLPILYGTVIQALGKWRWDNQNFRVILGYIEGLSPA